MVRTDAWENSLLDYMRGNGAFPSTVTAAPGAGSGYWFSLGLDGSVPQEDGTGFNEVSTSGTGYARAQMTTTNFSTGPSGGQMTNDLAITFGSTSLLSWGSVRYIGIHDAATAGNLLAWKELAAIYSIGVGKDVKLAAGAVTLVED